MSDQKSLEGYIVFVIVNQGSKNEHFAPILLMNQGEIIQLYKEGDNPFESESIKSYHLKYCRVSGNLDSKKETLLVSEIEEKPDLYLEAIQENSTNQNDEVVQKKEGDTDE
jgi:hypothetical protein